MLALNKRIVCFLEVSSCLNFSVAAEHLYLTQQAVTYRISELEKELGVKLFVRTTRSVSLTEAGRLFRDEFLKISRQADESIHLVQSIGYQERVSITIGFNSALSRSRIIVPIMEGLNRRFPDAAFVVKLYDFVELRNRLQDGELDLCINTCSDWRNWPLTKVSVLQHLPFELAYSSRHPLARLHSVSMSDLVQYNLLTLPGDTVVGGNPLELKIPHKDVITLPNLDTLLVYLESGAGFAYLTRAFEGAESGAFSFSPVPFEPLYADTICAYRSGMLNPTVIAAAQTIRLIMNREGDAR